MAATEPNWLATGWASHRGRRSINEDAVLVDGCLLAVADGVAGSPRGDLASHEAIESVQETVHDPPPTAQTESVTTELVHALEVADEAVKALAGRWGSLRGTATTMCAAMVFKDDDHAPRCVMANAGDSRGYVVRDGQAHQITDDHTLARALERAGLNSHYERANHIVTSVLGGLPDTSPEIDRFTIALEPGDQLVLCTDGISDVIDGERMAALVGQYQESPDAAAAALVRAAWDLDSSDNLTVIVAQLHLGQDVDQR